jgi:hypothetical protein
VTAVYIVGAMTTGRKAGTGHMWSSGLLVKAEGSSRISSSSRSRRGGAGDFCVDLPIPWQPERQ